MHRLWNSSKRRKVSLLTPALLACIAALALAACGGTKTGSGSGSSARTLLKQTFSGSHPINSGVLIAAVTITPAGSSVITGPVTLSFSGPFQSRGKGKLPASDFTVAITFEGHTGKLGIISTGTAGYVTLENTAYKLPAKQFQELESGVAGLSSGTGSSSSASTLSGLGIHPQNWLSDPTVVGTPTLDGVKTDHIHGSLALGPLLSDLATILSKASSTSSAASSVGTLSSAEQAKIKNEITGAGFDLYTGASDHTVRQLSVTGTLPVSGTLKTELGGLSSAQLKLTLGYSQIGQTQTIPTPTSSKPYSEFTKQLSSLILEIEQIAVSGSNSAGGTTTTG